MRRRLAPSSKSTWSASRTRSATRCSRATRRSAKKPGRASSALHEKKETVKGSIVGRVKGGFTVDLGGVNAFLPGSQVDIRPIRDVGPLMGQVQPFAILKMDRPRGNIVVSRRAVLEESRAEQRAEIVGNMAEGERRRGVVKNITDYGAFVDLGGIDGLLHVTDMSWKRVSHPSQVVEVGQEVEVQIIKINPETQRISLGMKQLMTDPWDGVGAKYPVGAKLKGRVTNITDYGAFVELEDGVEGLIHVSEMSWTKKNLHPGKIISSSQEVDVVVLDVDAEKRRISLGLKQVMNNPWEAVPRRASGRHEHRRRGSRHHRVRPVRGSWPGSRRHGPHQRHRLEHAGRRSHQEVQQGRHRQSARAGRRHRERAHLARHQAAQPGPDRSRSTCARTRSSPRSSPRSPRAASRCRSPTAR